MPRADDRVAKALARTQEMTFLEEEEQQEQVRSPRSPKKSVRSTKKSERVVINDVEMDIDKVVQRVKDRLSSPKPPMEERKSGLPSPKVLMEERRSIRNSPKDSPRETYVERPSPKSPSSVSRLPVKEIVTVEIIPEPADKRVSATTLSYSELKRSTRDELSTHLRSLNSEQLREEILKLRSEKSTVRSVEPRVQTRSEKRVLDPPNEKIPVYDEETGTYVLWSKAKLERMMNANQPPPVQQHYYQMNDTPRDSPPVVVKPPLYRRGTTRDAYPTKTMDHERTFEHQTNIVTVNPEIVEQSTDIDFDAMTEVQKREFLGEMKMKFSVFRKNFPNFPIPVIHDDDSPKWVFGIYEQLLDMAKTDASQPVYQTGLQVVFLILQVVLTISGIPAKNFFSFHAKNFDKYNTLMAELGEKWGPIIDITSSIETKLAIAIGWNTLVFAVVSVVAAKFGDKWGTTAEKLLDQLTTSGGVNSKMQDLERQLDGRETMGGNGNNKEQQPQAEQSSDPLGGLGGIANLLGGLLGNGGGGNNSGGGLGGLLGSLLGGGGPTAGNQASSTERRPPVYDD
jgi:hypothetical protein